MKIKKKLLFKKVQTQNKILILVCLFYVYHKILDLFQNGRHTWLEDRRYLLKFEKGDVVLMEILVIFYKGKNGVKGSILFIFMNLYKTQVKNKFEQTSKSSTYTLKQCFNITHYDSKLYVY